MKIGIRAWRLSDAQDLAAALNNRKIQNNLRDGIPYPYTVQDAEEYITGMLNADRDAVFAWAITVDDRAVGSIGVFRQANIHRRTAEMGYYVAEEWWGQGIGTTAVRDNTDIVRIFAEPFAYNTASCRVLEKAGFVCEGTLRKNALKNGDLLDMKLYALVKE
jgi:RimJ/RimL family protein N-acetyltransferase